ncbi:SAV_6107 family HEPN domain-containing protein, partial [Actinomadura sp. BRA 177]|uniref:SAV_6107 family HEPN domain-containing protein n=1 Tax=Actinomadura sp. BRA 177 TaxID=2745202 RepID=UPI0020CC246F
MTARGVHSAAQSVPPPSPRHRPLPAPRPAHTAVGQLHAARMGLAEAAEASSPAVRYVCAHLAALRAAAAVLASKEPLETHRRGRPRSAGSASGSSTHTPREWA